jgi:hypothetical protein
VRAADLGLALAAAAALAVLWRLLRRRRDLPGAVGRLAQAIPDALGDGVLAIDGEGRIADANPIAARLAGSTVAELVDRDLADLVPELAALARGLDLGPASARISMPGAATPVQAALVRVVARPPWALVVLRPLPPPRPPAIPSPAPAPWPPGSDARRGLAAAAAALRDPVAEASGALSLLRLAAPPLAPRAGAALATAEAALEVAARRTAALSRAGQPAAIRRPLDVRALVADLVEGFPAPTGIRVRCELHPARAVVDEGPLRSALRELLGAAAAALPGGGELGVSVRTGPAAVLLEIAAPAGVAASGVALARALLAPQGGRVEEDDAAGRGTVLRIAVEGAPALEPA